MNFNMQPKVPLKVVADDDIQRLLDDLRSKNTPRTAYGFRAMLEAYGLKVEKLT